MRSSKPASPVAPAADSVSSDDRDVRSRGTTEDARSIKTPSTTGSGVRVLLGMKRSAPKSVSDGTVSPGTAGEDYPEGGIRAWLVVLGCWLALFASLGFMNSLSTFRTYLTSNNPIHIGPGVLGGAIFGYATLSLLLGVYAGPLFDCYGPRWLILAGTGSLVVSFLLASFSTEYGHLLAALGILSSLGTPLLFTPSVAAVGHFFKDRRGLATGIAMTGSSASAVLFPFILQGLFMKVGWAWAMRALALICFSIAVATNFLLRSRLPAAANPHPHGRIFRTKGFTPTVVAIFLAQFASFLPLSYMSAYALSKGFTQIFSFEVVTIVNASSVAGRVLAGWWADRVGPFNASVVFSSVAALACFGIWLPAGGTMPGIIIFAVIFGCTSGASVTLAPVAVGRLCRTQEYGRYYGACYTIVSLGVLLAIPVASTTVRGNRGEFWGLIIITGVFYMAATAAFAFAKFSVVGRRIWVPF
ncbi:major facilitator superfamily domain-containing protein [Staphylotrichum tortipilum]|uniref:Major facilitator superfamily domain-containing protein n=1 Tax=Staphylotrichum tortipilum TaxID=2831512 RepID=A0AAN6RUX6_9PEZI|nr:major facilitator superfamily domain-containing protein [Staphylotrichum longicolle]